jgi:hypothetical protein
MQSLENIFSKSPAEKEVEKKIIFQNELLENLDPPEIINRFQSKMADPKIDPHEQKWLFKKLDLSNNSSQKQIEEAVTKRLDFYIDKFNQFNHKLPEQQAAISKYLVSMEISPAQKLNEIPLYIYDSVFGSVVPELKYRSFADGQFIAALNAIVVSVEAPNWVSVHEYAHAMSYLVGKSECGWRKIDEQGLPEIKKSNNWLDEVCAMKLEFAVSESNLENRKKSDECYYTYYLMGKIFQKQTKIDDQLLLKGYFGDPQARMEVENHCRKQYGYSLFELGDIMLGFNPKLRKQTLDLLKGKPVNFQTTLTRDSGLEEKYQNMTKLFPNFSAEISFYD